MNILLTAINAKYIHSNLAVYSLKASAGVYSDRVELAEYTINHQEEEIFRSVYQKKPDLLFLSCYIWNRNEILALAQNLHKVLPGIVIWAGGPEVSYDATEFLEENPEFSGVMMGEGEEIFRRVLAFYIDGKGTLGQIPGIAYRDDQQEGRIRQNLPETLRTGLDHLPFVYQDLKQFENRILYYETSRGCPFSCSYCLSSIDKTVRFRSLDLVFRELGFFLEHRAPQVKFVDRTFNCSHVHAMAIWSFIREHDNGITNFHFEIAADLLNAEELALLAGMRPGLVQLEIGVQTVNEQSLEAIHRTAKFEEIAKKVRQVAAAGNIHQHLDLIAGLPYEDFESFKSSFDAVYRLHPQELQLGFLKVLRGSLMHRKAEEYGIIYRSRPPYEVLETRWITCGQLLRLKEVEEMLEVYYNSQQFRCTISALEKEFDRPFALYEALADFYKEQKLDGKAHSRMQRFEILKTFIGQMEAEKVQEQKGGTAEDAGCAARAKMPRAACSQKYTELLTRDLYLRENAKSRPSWAADTEAYRAEKIRFYQEEEQRRRYLPQYAGMTWKQLMRMTHLERFSYGKEKAWWELFDYSKRDPLTQDAAVTVIVQDLFADLGQEE